MARTLWNFERNRQMSGPPLGWSREERVEWASVVAQEIWSAIAIDSNLRMGMALRAVYESETVDEANLYTLRSMVEHFSSYRDGLPSDPHECHPNDPPGGYVVFVPEDLVGVENRPPYGWVERVEESVDAFSEETRPKGDGAGE